MNSVTLVGNVGKDDPKVTYFESGSVLAELSIAVKGDKKDAPPNWIELKFWGKIAQVVADYVKSGSKIGVVGRINQEKWTDKTSGQNRSKLVVIVDRLELLGTKRDSEAGSGFGGEPSNEEVPF